MWLGGLAHARAGTGVVFGVSKSAECTNRKEWGERAKAKCEKGEKYAEREIVAFRENHASRTRPYSAASGPSFSLPSCVAKTPPL